MRNMKKILSFLLASSMVLSYVPMPALAEDSVCTHHVHDANCGYVAKVEGSDCSHQCNESCTMKDVTQCVHNHEAEGCTYTPAAEEVKCDYVHGEGCSHVYAQDEVPCTCGAEPQHTAECASVLAEGVECNCTPILTHAEGCNPKAAVAESCNHVHGECAYKEAVQESWSCGHACTVDTGCVKAVCAHEHNADCGYVKAVDSKNCTFDCEECKAEKEKVCTCESTDPGEHAPFCDLYVRTYEDCLCQLSCSEEGLNEYCETCYFEGVDACGSGEEEQTPYADSDFEFSNGKITKYKGSDAVVEIPSTINGVAVTAIGNYAFYGCSDLTSVTIPASVTIIGNYAFCGCSSLTSVTIPASVTAIGSFAFYDCSSLKTVDYCGFSEPTMGSYVFGGCSVSAVNVPEYYEDQNFGSMPINPGGVILPSEPTTYTVTFDSNGGTGTMDSATGVSGIYTLPECTFTAPAGKQFKAWSVGGVEKAEGETITVSADTTVTANWKDVPATYKITYHLNGGNFTGEYPESYTEGVGVTLPKNVTRESYLFKYWSSDPEGNYPTDSIGDKATGPKMFYAIWEPVLETYTITYKPGANGSGTETADTKTEGTTLTLRGSIFTRSFYKQTGWATEESGEKVYDLKGDYTEDAPVTLYPVWEPETYKINYVLDGGEITGDYPDTYTYGVGVALPKNVTKENYDFMGWYDQLTGGTGPISSIGEKAAGDKTYYARWNARPVSITLNKSTLSLNVGAEETLTATITPDNAANKNVTWSSSDTSVATVSENGTVNAVAPGTATITVTTEDGDKVATCDVNVTYLPAPSYTIEGAAYENDGVYWFADGASAIVKAPSDYTISTSLNAQFASSVSITQPTSVYFKNESGILTDAINLSSALRWDITAPTGSITLVDTHNTWNGVTDKPVTVYTQNKNITVTAMDNESGIASIEYSVKSEPVSGWETIDDWKACGETIVLTENARSVVYVKITDNVGNQSCLSTDILYVDTTAPVISGIADGTTYYTTQKATATDNAALDTLTGTNADGTIPGDPAQETKHTIVATDKAGNTTTFEITMKPISSLTAGLSTEDTVKLTDKDAIEAIKKNISDVLTNQSANATEEEKDNLEDIIAQCNDLLNQIKKAEDVIALIQALPDAFKVEPDNKKHIDAYDAALAAYNDPNLPASSKRMVGEENKAKLDAVGKALVAYEIIHQSSKYYVKGSGKTLAFTANGYYAEYGSYVANAYGKFVSIEVDGKVVDAKNYTAKAGSTVITLKTSYLESLSVGKHTIKVNYIDGSTDGEDTFRISVNNGNPFTGDDTHMMLFGGMALTSLLGMAMMIVFFPRKKGKYQR